MSTYYYLGCKQCENYTRLVGRWFPSRWGMLPDAEDMNDIPKFVSLHEGHITEMCVISEYDIDGAFEHWSQYPSAVYTEQGGE